MNSCLKKFFISVFLISFFSCSEELDFKQLNDLTISPVFDASLIYFKVLPDKFFTTAGTLMTNSISDVTLVRAFENTYVKENIFQLDVNVICKNEFTRNISIQIEFLDINGNPTYMPIIFEVTASELNFNFKEIILIEDYPNFVDTLQVRITTSVQMLGAPLTAADTNEFELKSSTTAYLKSTL